MQKRKSVFFGALTGTVIMLLACQNPSIGSDKSSSVFTRDNIGSRYDVSGNAVKTIAYVEVNRASPLNAGSYAMEKVDGDGNPVLDENGDPVMQPLFDYVVLFAANIRNRDCSLEANGSYDCTKSGVHLHFNENVRYLLDNRETYIQPLQEKGIKVLLGLLGDHDGIGFGYMNAGQLEIFATDVKSALQLYNLDGIDFDEEWSTKEGTLDENNNNPDGIAVYPSAPSNGRVMYRKTSVPIEPGNGWFGFGMPPDWSESENGVTGDVAIWQKGGRTFFEVLKKFREVLPADKIITLYEYGTAEKITPNGNTNSGTWGTGLIFPESKDTDPTTNVTVEALTGIIDFSLYPYYGDLEPNSLNGIPNKKWVPLAIDVGGFAYEGSDGMPLPTWDNIESYAEDFISDRRDPYAGFLVYDIERSSKPLLGADGISYVGRDVYLSILTKVVFGRETVTVDDADYPHWGDLRK